MEIFWFVCLFIKKYPNLAVDELKPPWNVRGRLHIVWRVVELLLLLTLPPVFLADSKE